MTERLRWDQNHAIKKEFHLRKGSVVMAELRFPSIWSSRAKGSIRNEALDIIPEGVIHQRFRVSSEVLDNEFAVARLPAQVRKQAEIELPSGLRYELTSKGLFHRVWTLSEVDAGGRKGLFALIETRGFLKESSYIEISEYPSNDHDFLVLALLVWYIVVTIHEREAPAL
jgi:hypothetical protein